jgi:hypothetical protein
MMTNQLQFRKWPAFSVLLTFFWCCIFTTAQSATAQTPPQDHDNVRSAEDRDTTRHELASFDQFLDSHRETAEQLRKDPSLVDNQQFLKDHPALETYLKDHPAVRQELRENPNAFMKEEDRFDRHEDDRDRDANRRELANFDRFLDNHREIAEQLRKDPSLVDNQKFLNDHPVLQSYLKDHPGVRQELRENPNAFMQEEARYDRREDAMNREGGGDHDFDHSHSANFGEFLGAHANIAQDLSKDPSLAKSQDYLQDHPELQDYLNSHPEVRQDLQADPQNFLKSAQQFNNNGQGIKPPTAPTADSKPKQ